MFLAIAEFPGQGFGKTPQGFSRRSRPIRRRKAIRYDRQNPYRADRAALQIVSGNRQQNGSFDRVGRGCEGNIPAPPTGEKGIGNRKEGVKHVRKMAGTGDKIARSLGMADGFD